MKNLFKKNQIISFILISYIISWACWVPILDLIESDVFSSPLYVVVLLLIGGYSPSLSAIILCVIIGGKTAVKDLFRRFKILKVKSKWYAAVTLIPLLLLFISIMIYVFTGGKLGWVNYQVFLWLPVFYIIAAFFGPLGEELGWRGFLLPRVLKKYNFFSSSIIIGVVWTFWHAPLFWANEGTSISGDPVTFISIGKYLLFVTGTSFIYTWVFKNTRESVFLAFLLHMFTNGSHMAMNYLLPNIEDKKAVWNIEVWVLWVMLLASYIVAKLIKNKEQLN